MVSAKPPYKFTFYEGEKWYFADAPEGPNGTQEFKGTLTGYTLDVFDGPTKVHNEAFSKGGTGENMTYYDSGGTPHTGATARDDGYWGGKTGNYSTLLELDPANWDTPAEGGKKYRIRVQYDTTNAWDKIVSRIDATCSADFSV